MKRITRIEKIKANQWEWRVVCGATGEGRAAGYCKTKTSAQSDAKAWINHIENEEARHAGRVVAGDTVYIKPEWQDDGDDEFTFIATQTQLEGQREIKIKAVNIETKISIGTQSIMAEMLDKTPRN